MYLEDVYSYIECGEFEDESKRYLSLFSPREYFNGSFVKSSVLFYVRNGYDRFFALLILL
jgi:hypothetical protein